MAEVLITLGIIGVVAALTLPSLIQKYQDQVLENQLKKMYSTISQGVQKAKADDGVSKFSDTELYQSCTYSERTSNACVQMVKKYFNVVAVKTTTRKCYEGLIQSKYEYIDGHITDNFLGYSRDKSKRRMRTWGIYDSGVLTYVLADGSEFMFITYPGWDDARIDVDTNGEKGPNTYGLDIFFLSVDGYGRFRDVDHLEPIQKNNWKFPW